MQVLQVQLEVRPDPAEVGRARRWARSRLAGSGIAPDEPLAETLVLLISELVTNAVVHTGCPAVLRMLLPDAAVSGTGTESESGSASGSGSGSGSGAGSGVPGARTEQGAGAVRGTVRVEVADRSAHAPKPRHAEGDDTNGRGLELVSGLADRWGWCPEDGGKSIWCEIDRGGPCVAPQRAGRAQVVANPDGASPVPPLGESVVRPVGQALGHVLGAWGQSAAGTSTGSRPLASR
ncbi:ATP-binding protein [Streptomyces sp. NPDC047108]|uniref:ATP-binding protein n=1 Tax=Streptomyces sp. NPDC047108 TaxID=3155025 RepID=UPI0033F75C33